MLEREQVCRSILEHAAAIERLEHIYALLRERDGITMLITADGAQPIGQQCALDILAAVHIRRTIGLHKLREWDLAGVLGLGLERRRDVLAFARAQLGMPIDAPSTLRIPRSTKPASWERDLALMTGAPAA